jgi:hypothetical protein
VCECARDKTPEMRQPFGQEEAGHDGKRKPTIIFIYL